MHRYYFLIKKTVEFKMKYVPVEIFYQQLINFQQVPVYETKDVLKLPQVAISLQD